MHSVHGNLLIRAYPTSPRYATKANGAPESRRNRKRRTYWERRYSGIGRESATVRVSEGALSQNRVAAGSVIAAGSSGSAPSTTIFRIL
jgi:hypothetical protein